MAMTQCHKACLHLIVKGKLNLSFNLMKTKRSLILLLSLIGISTITFSCIPTSSGGGGCAGPGVQGWSGFTSSNSTLYLGSMDGKVLALNPSARSKGLTFPSEGEWSYVMKTPAASGSMCGPLGCAPAATPVAIYSTPAVASGLVYVGTYNGKIYALNAATGALRWVFPREGYETIGAIVGDLLAVDNTIYVNSSNGKVYALDAPTGDLKWESATGGKIWTSPTVSGGVVYVTSYDGNVYALSRQNGSQLWKFKSSAAISSSPIVSEENVFFGTFDRHLYAISKIDGQEKWKFEGGNWFWSNPLVKDDVVYAGCLDHKIYALEAKTGNKLWDFDVKGQIASTPVLAGNFIIVISESGEMYIIEADSGKEKRHMSINYSVMAPLYAEGNMVYVHARNRCVYSVDVQSGEVAWKFCYSDTNK